MENLAKKAEARPTRRSTSGQVSIRVPEATLARIDSAARALGKTRTDFMLDTAREKAEHVILDRRTFDLNETDSASLRRLLEHPPTPVEELRALMSSKAPWE
jgi:uncharacterized protein (DUF1778 family)